LQCWLIFRSPLREDLKLCGGVEPVVIGTAGLLFGLFAACLAILITNEFPFSPMNPISPEPLQKALESLNR